MITLSPEAVKKIKELKAEANLAESAGLRVAVVGGGCSGLSYKLDFADSAAADDKVFEQDGVRVFVDPKSFLYLRGMTLEYSGGLNGTGFGFSNPNATKKCGCGSSFAVS